MSLGSMVNVVSDFSQKDILIARAMLKIIEIKSNRIISSIIMNNRNLYIIFMPFQFIIILIWSLSIIIN